MARVHNFNPGPSALPLPALEAARAALCDWNGTGIGILEHSHRGKAYEALHHETLETLRRLLEVPSTHEVLLMQGGASALFAVVPMNLLSGSARAGYVITGSWGEKAFREAKLVGDAYIAARTSQRVPKADEIVVEQRTRYVHITTNETIDGVQFADSPNMTVDLVADMSSDIMSRPWDFRPYAVAYAGAQKNLGPAGLVVVIVKKEALAGARTDIPQIFRFATHAENRSLYNTIPTFAVLVMREVCRWVESNGGTRGMQERNQRKAQTLYAALRECSPFYSMPVEQSSRSLMNVVFRTPSPELDDAFVQGAEERSLVGLRGHRTVGGMRASLYNAVEPASVDLLASYVREFAKRYG